MKKLFSTAFLLTFALVFAACGQTAPQENSVAEESAKTFTLAKAPFGEEIHLTGTIEANKESIVAAKIGGRIATLTVDIGDPVETGAFLGDLYGDESAVALQTSALNEANMQAVYEAQKILLAEQIKNAEMAVAVAQANFDALVISEDKTALTTEEQIKLAEKTVNQAQTALDNTKKMADQRLVSLYNSASSAFLGALIAIENANGFADGLLGVSDSKKNLNLEVRQYLGIFNQNTVINAKSSLKSALAGWGELNNLYYDKIQNQNPSDEEIDGYLNIALSALEKAQISLKDTYNVLDSSSTGANFTTQDLQNLKTEIAMLKGNLERAVLTTEGGLKLGIKGIILNREEILTQNAAEIAAAEQGLLQAEQGLAQAKVGGDQNISTVQSQREIAEKQIRQAETALESAKAQKDSALRSLETQLNLAKGGKNLSAVGVENTKLTAPFAGVITQKHAEIGQVVMPGQPIFTVADTSAFKIKTDIADTEVGKITVGTEAIITIDGLQEPLQATVSKINPQIDPLSRKLKIELSLAASPANVKIGMFAQITILLPPTDSFLIPKDFLKADFGGSYVLLENGKKQTVSKEGAKNGMVKIYFPEIADGIVIKK